MQEVTQLITAHLTQSALLTQFPLFSGMGETGRSRINHKPQPADGPVFMAKGEDPKIMRIVTYACGLQIPHRNVFDYYRLTPQAKEVRRKKGMGKWSAWIKEFMDISEAATQHPAVCALRHAGVCALSDAGAHAPAMESSGLSRIRLPAVWTSLGVLEEEA